MSDNHHNHGACPHCWQEEWKKLQELDGFDRGISLIRLSRFAWRAKQWTYSMRLAEEALAIFQGNDAWLANQAECYAAISINARELGRIDEAYALLETALDLYRQSGDDTGVLWENNRCYWKFEDKQYTQALDYYRLTLLSNRGKNDLASVVFDLIMVGRCLYKLGQYEEAISKYREARQLSKSQNQSYYVAMCDHNIGESLLALGQKLEAQTEVEKALRVMRLHKYDRRTGECLKLMGEVYAAQEMWEPALGAFEESLSFMRNQNPPWMEKIVEIENSMATIYRQTGREGDAASIVARLERLSSVLSDESETIAS